MKLKHIGNKKVNEMRKDNIVRQVKIKKMDCGL